MGIPIQEFRGEIYKRIEKVKDMGQHSIVINFGKLHRDMGVYPNKGHRFLPVAVL